MQSIHPVVARARNELDAFLADLEAIVNIDSGTDNKAGVDRVGAYLQRRFLEKGYQVRFDHQTQYGNHLIATHPGENPNGARILLIGHMDTVFLDGEAQQRPFRICAAENEPEKRIAKGPGVLDMKSGLLIGIYAVELLEERNYQHITFLFNSDEEIGSPSSKPLVTELAQEADAVIVLEPGRELGSVVSSRRGSGLYRVEVHGIAAHAGVEPQKGRNAIVELAHLVGLLQELHGTIPGTSLSVTTIQGGTRGNVVPEYACCEMDVRASTRAGIKALEGAIRKTISRRKIEGTTVSLSGGFRCQPFEPSERNAHLVHMAQEAGAELGIQIQALTTGGASDANTTASLGIPTIDGLGAGGGKAHNPDEYIELDYLPERIALLTGLIQRITLSLQNRDNKA
ncbi:glutamate carboxypeptidase [Thermosporothrix hazakensis]|jgi:glutamate carboxypeptidase|uniref:Glutamate carboxypeptidase n=1 Tax=Thermosporothrix hazakensis TaxID=644383 RepID=A0A326U2I3_THEHA|nr:M20 family metallopeptidase [Thermosporothrix hazakensis]PZW25638.1 glutamate carboxypeptidase [Thermosporothrix hazakensis]GCE48133.1 peptidase M20 [Thermosporothrix hazakensis]